MVCQLPCWYVLHGYLITTGLLGTYPHVSTLYLEWLTCPFQWWMALVSVVRSAVVVNPGTSVSSWPCSLQGTQEHNHTKPLGMSNTPTPRLNKPSYTIVSNKRLYPGSFPLTGTKEPGYEATKRWDYLVIQWQMLTVNWDSYKTKIYRMCKMETTPP